MASKLKNVMIAGLSALYPVFADARELTTEDLVAEAARTRPLSRIMGERLVELRQWAADRTVAAD